MNFGSEDVFKNKIITKILDDSYYEIQIFYLITFKFIFKISQTWVFLQAFLHYFSEINRLKLLSNQNSNWNSLETGQS